MKISTFGDGEWYTVSTAAQVSGLSRSRILKLATEGVIPSRDWPIPGTRLVVTVLDAAAFDEWFASHGRNRTLQYVIDVPGKDFEEVHAFLSAHGIHMRRRSSKPVNADKPFADLVSPEPGEAGEGDMFNIDELIEREHQRELRDWRRTRNTEEDE